MNMNPLEHVAVNQKSVKTSEESSQSLVCHSKLEMIGSTANAICRNIAIV